MTALVRQLHPGRLLARTLVGLIRIYQIVLSPLLGDVCRFYPSCSRYAATCLTRFGLLRGSYLAAGRICRCHPFHPGGVDLPPAEDGCVRTVAGSPGAHAGEPSEAEADSLRRSERPAAKDSPGRAEGPGQHGGRGGREPHALEDRSEP